MTAPEEENSVSGDTEQEEAQEPPTERAVPPEPSDERDTPLPPVQVPDRYDPDRCRITFSITMLEEDGHPDGRRVLIGARNDEDIPLTKLVRAPGLASLLPVLTDLQAELEASLPQRQEAMRLKLEEARRKAKAPSQATPEQAPQEAATQATPPTATPPAAVQATPKATATKLKKTMQRDESPFEQMTLFR